jgi:hypothetical protein
MKLADSHSRHIYAFCGNVEDYRTPKEMPLLGRRHKDEVMVDLISLRIPYTPIFL